MLHSFPILTTDRLTLRSIELEDAEAYHEIAAFPRDTSFTVEDTQSKIKSLLEGYERGEMIVWALEYNGHFAGTCGYYRGFKNQTGEIGYVIKEAYKRKGLMTEAVKAVMEFGFTALILKMITAYTKDNNKNSIGLLKQFGFQPTDQCSDDNRRHELKRPKN